MWPKGTIPLVTKTVKKCGKLLDVQGIRTTKDKKRKFLRIIETDTQN